MTLLVVRPKNENRSTGEDHEALVKARECAQRRSNVAWPAKSLLGARTDLWCAGSMPRAAAIEDHGLIGDMHTAAMVSVEGTVDWLCLPHFDSPSVFAQILDEERGGFWSLRPDNGESLVHRQFYWPGTNVLVTRILAEHGAIEITDFMPVRFARGSHQHHVVRRVDGVRGETNVSMVCRPAFDYGRTQHEVRVEGDRAVLRTKDLELTLSSDVPLRASGEAVDAHFTLCEGESVTFTLSEDEECSPPARVSPREATEMLDETVSYWRRWIAQSTYRGRWREVVERSAMVLKLLTYEPTGAIIAAPTSSLPETIAGPRNWDYRYTWIRDSAFTLYAFLKIGFTEEAKGFMRYLEGLCEAPCNDGPIQIMYGIDGRRELDETILSHFSGYRGSSPVRVGNDAHRQLQLDIYGELMDSIYLANKHATPVSHDLWEKITGFIDWLADNWQRKDEGIWEVRGGARHFVFSKLMSWVAFDRALRLADKRSFPADRVRWRRIRDEIYREIMEHGWSEERQAFVQSYGSRALDASLLMMPLTFFIAPNDPRMLSTIDAILESPKRGGLVSNSLVYRYDVEEATDGLEGKEGTFNICTFWLVEAQARAGRYEPARLDQARVMFERMLGFSNHLGLYAEETGPRGEALGNFPQAFTHLSLISAAFNLNRELDRSHSPSHASDTPSFPG